MSSRAGEKQESKQAELTARKVHWATDMTATRQAWMDSRHPPERAVPVPVPVEVCSHLKVHLPVDFYPQPNATRTTADSFDLRNAASSIIGPDKRWMAG